MERESSRPCKRERPRIRPSLHCIPFRISYCEKRLSLVLCLAYPYPNLTYAMWSVQTLLFLGSCQDVCVQAELLPDLSLGMIVVHTAANKLLRYDQKLEKDFPSDPQPLVQHLTRRLFRFILTLNVLISKDKRLLKVLELFQSIFYPKMQQHNDQCFCKSYRNSFVHQCI